MATDFVVELIKQMPDRRVQLIQAEEPLVPKAGHDPPLSQKHCAFDFSFVFWFVRSRGGDCCIVVASHVRVCTIDRRIIETGLGHTGFQIVANHLRGHAAEELKGTHMTGYPIGQALRPARLDVCVTRRTKRGDKELRCAHFARLGADHIKRGTGIINKQPFARRMALPHDRR